MEFLKGFMEGYRGSAGAKDRIGLAQFVKLVLLCLLGSAVLASRHGETVTHSNMEFWYGSVIGYFLAVFSVLLITGGLGFGITWLVRPLRGVAPHVAGFLVVVLFLAIRVQFQS